MTKYSISDDHEWADEKQQEQESARNVYIDDHTVRIVDKSAADRPKGINYEFSIIDGENEWEPYAIPMRKYKWAGNFWRVLGWMDDTDWEDIPTGVKLKLVSVVEGAKYPEDISPLELDE